MRAASPVISLSLAWCALAPTAVHAMGFGPVVNGTQLGQPLDFSAVVKLDGDESLARECVFADVAAGDNRISPGFVRIAVTGVPGGTGRVVRVSTSTPIDEPIVTVSVTLGCASRVTRQFVAFVDPPGTASAPAVPAAVPTTAATLADATPAGGAARLAETALPRRDEAVPRSARGRVAAPTEPPRKRATPVRAVVATGPRLRLDAPATAVVAPPTAAPAAAPPPLVAAAVPASAPDEDALARERKRVASLEADLAAVRAESKAQQQALAALQVRVGTTRSQRYANPLVYSLAALCLLLTIVVCGLLGRRSRDRAAARWLTSTMLAKSAAPAALTASEPKALEAPAAAASPPPVDATLPAVVVTAPDRVAAVGRALSAEELVDLEQQADFFVVLGQEDAAIELLNGHVGRGGDGASSPMPLLKLLELHRRVGDRAEYDRVRARIDRHFNARTPGFDADPVRGATLEDSPDVVARLQALWPAPAQALDALDRLVFRRHPSDPGFDLPAFRELLFLRCVATDNASRANVEVDVLLPVDAYDGALPSAPRSNGDTGRTVDVDVTAAPARPAASRAPGRPLPVLTVAASPFDGAETMPSALRRSPDYDGESAFVDLELEFPALVAETSLPR